MAALLTPIKTGRHFIALAYQICWRSGINKSSNKYELRTLPACLPPCLTRTKQKSLLPMNLMPPPPPPSPAASPVSFESVSCFVSFSDKFFHGFCLLLSHFFFLLFFFFFLLLFLCDFVFCHKLHWSTSPATCRCKDAPQFPT